MKKLISLFLVFSLMMLSVNLYAKEKRGAELIITKTDGQRIKGELIISDTEGKDVSINITDIRVIWIRKSKLGKGTIFGTLSGASLSATLLGLLGLTLPRGFELSVWIKAMSAGAAIGALMGAAGLIDTGKDETLQIEGMTDFELWDTMEKLRKESSNS